MTEYNATETIEAMPLSTLEIEDEIARQCFEKACEKVKNDEPAMTILGRVLVWRMKRPLTPDEAAVVGKEIFFFSVSVLIFSFH